MREGQEGPAVLADPQASGDTLVPAERGDPGADRSGSSVATMLSRSGLVIALVALFAVFSIALPSTFPTWGNVSTIASSQGVLVVLALAITLPLRCGDFDISVASVMTLSAALSAVLMTHGTPPLAAMAAGVVAGLCCGLLNALVVVGVGVNAFIVTLGTMTVADGLSYALTGGLVVSGMPDVVIEFATGRLFGIPLIAFYGWILAAGLWYVYQLTPFGRHLLFVGGNAEASRLAGVRVSRVRLAAFVSAGGLAGFAGVALLGQLGSADPGLGAQYLLPPYAAAFLGTTTVQIGRFNVLGTLIGTYFLAVGITGLQLLGGSPAVSNLFNGGALVVAVVLSRLVQKRRTAR